MDKILNKSLYGNVMRFGVLDTEYYTELLSENKKLTIQEINRVSERSSFDFNYKYKTDTWTATRNIDIEKVKKTSGLDQLYFLK